MTAGETAQIFGQSPSRYLGQEQVWQCTFESCWNQVDEATSCGFNSRPALQFPTGHGAVMKTLTARSLDSTCTVQWRLPESRVTYCCRADKSLTVGSYGQQQVNYSTYEGCRMTTKTIQLYLAELDCSIEATVNYTEPQWENEFPVFSSVQIEKQEVTITSKFQNNQLRKLI